MSELIRTLDDAAIEAMLARRVPGHADRMFLADVVAAATISRQDRGWSMPRLGRPRLAWVAIAAAMLLVAGLLLVAGGSHPPAPPLPSAPAPSALALFASPSTLPSASSSPAASAETCATQTTQVLVGAAMPPTTTRPATMPAGVLQIGAYVTLPPEGSVPDGGSAFNPTHVWVISSGTAKRIASVVGPDFDIAQVTDVSPDGSRILLQVGVQHGGDPGPECDDLYLLAADGSSVRRLTTYGAGEHARYGQFSPDGRLVEFIHQASADAPQEIGVIDLEGDPTPRLSACGNSLQEIQVAWRPDSGSSRLAATCGFELLQLDPTNGTEGRIAFPFTGDHVMALGWHDQDTLAIVSAVDGTSANAPLQLWTMTSQPGLADGTFDPPIEVSPRLAQGDYPTAVAPDGHALGVIAMVTDFSDATWYLVDVTTGKAAKVRGAQNFDELAWTRDSRRLIDVHRGNDNQVSLAVIDAASGQRRVYGSIPFNYFGGIWRGA